MPTTLLNLCTLWPATISGRSSAPFTSQEATLSPSLTNSYCWLEVELSILAILRSARPTLRVSVISVLPVSISQTSSVRLFKLLLGYMPNNANLDCSRPDDAG